MRIRRKLDAPCALVYAADMARYQDTSPLRPPVQLDTGAWRVEAVVPATVQRYGGVAEWVSPEALQDPEYVDALAGLPVLWRDGDHPSGDGLVTADDLGGAERIGTVLGQRWDDEAGQIVALSVDDPDNIEKVRSYPFISMGYRAAADPRPGVTPDGVRYDRRQIGRRPNHIVLTHAPRGGHAASVRLDTEDDPATPAAPDGDPMEETMTKILAMLEAMQAQLAAMQAVKEDTADEAADPAVEAPAVRMDTTDDVRALITAADRLQVDIAGKALPVARAEVLAAMQAQVPAIRLDVSDDMAAQTIAVYAAAMPAHVSQAERIAGSARAPSTSAGRWPPPTA